MFALTCADRLFLYDLIDQRCEKMIAEGLIDEVYQLLKDNVWDIEHALEAISPPDKATKGEERSTGRPTKRARGPMLSIGYIHVLKLLLGGEVNLERFQEFLTTFQSSSRSLARKQLSWLRTISHGITRKTWALCVCLEVVY